MVDLGDLIGEIKVMLARDIGETFEFRRVEKVGPKVSVELLKSGIIAIGLSLAAKLVFNKCQTYHNLKCLT